ncbi:hypothetical protein [Sutcliffiella horikoshii]|uniref:hypothetical protein n=1 Tax=Sutcliffiella horikoshii TaxID=79883 RepID=UPI003CF4915D
MKKISILIIFLVFLVGCNLDLSVIETADKVSDQQEEKVKKEVVNSVEQTEWQGVWKIADFPDATGYLVIYDETDEALTFDIHVAYTHVGSMENTRAFKSGDRAYSVEDEVGCIMTLKHEGNKIVTDEGDNCWEYSGAAIDLSHTFIQVTKDPHHWNQLVLDDTFPEKVKKGYLTTELIKLNGSLSSVSEVFGSATDTQHVEGADFSYYGDIGVAVDENFGDGDTILTLSANVNDNYTRDDVVKTLGEPSTENTNLLYDTWSLGYDIGVNYRLVFHLDLEDYSLLWVDFYLK